MSDISYADGPSHVAGSRNGPPDASSTNIIARPPGTADQTWASFVDTLAKTGAYHPDAIAKARAATEPGPPPAPQPSAQFRPAEIIGPAGVPLSADSPINMLTGSAQASAEAMGEIIAKGLALAPTHEQFAPPADNRYDLALHEVAATIDPTEYQALHAEMNAALSAMQVPSAHGRAFSRALIDSVSEVSEMPSFQSYQRAADDFALGRITEDELKAQTSAWNTYVAETRKTVENVLHRSYTEVVPIAQLAFNRLDPAVAKSWAREGAFESAGVMIALYKQGLLLQAKAKR
jgi:hypothetical protein